MDGVFMRKIIKFTCTAVVAVSLFLVGLLITDSHYLRNEVIRLRVVAASDSEQDQALKIRVKDAVNGYLQNALTGMENAAAVRAFLDDNLAELKQIADAVLAGEGDDFRANVYLTREMADRRDYETFSLPTGRYETLRIDIGPAEGENWWCVVFPSLCMPQTAEGFAETATDAGVSSGLTKALTGGKPVRVRFFLLDVIGKVEKIFDIS